MRVTCDASDVHEATERAEDAFLDMPDEVYGFVEAGAEALRETDPYQNRTGNLRASTRAVRVDAGLEFSYRLEMYEPYASYVRDLGFSRVDEFGMLGGYVDTWIQNHFEVIAAKIG